MRRGQYLLVVHTFQEVGEDVARVRIISARRADPIRDSRIRGAAMRPEYDFSKGVRGKFYKPDAELRLPVYLDADVQQYLAERAADKGIPLGDLVNGLLKREIQIIESIK